MNRAAGKSRRRPRIEKEYSGVPSTQRAFGSSAECEVVKASCTIDGFCTAAATDSSSKCVRPPRMSRPMVRPNSS